MNAFILTVILGQMMAQAPAEPIAMAPCYPWKDTPEEQAHYVIMKRTGVTLHGYVKKDDVEKKKKTLLLKVWFVEDKNGIERGQGKPDYIQTADIAEHNGESERQRDELIDDYLRHVHRVRVQTPSGELWVLEEEAQSARKAREASEGNRPPEENPLAAYLLDETQVESGLESAEVSGEAGPPGFLTLWGPHLLIVAVTVLLAGAVGYMTLRGE